MPSTKKQPESDGPIRQLNTTGAELVAAYLATRGEKQRNAVLLHFDACIRLYALRFHRALHQDGRKLLNVDDVLGHARKVMYERGLGDYDGSIPLTAYIGRFLRWRLIDELRLVGAYRKPRYWRGEHELLDVPSVATLDRIQSDKLYAGDWANPSYKSEHAEFELFVVSRLPCHVRRFVELHYFRGFRFMETCVLLGIGVGVGRHRKRTAIVALRKILDRPDLPLPSLGGRVPGSKFHKGYRKAA